jgi:hypothetical protein
MISRIHSKFGTAGLVVAIVALVVALTGAAFAAGGLTSKQKKEVTKIAKKYAGKQGPAGPQGLAGPAGKDGSNGTNGTNGTDGTDGVDGKSVVLTTEAAGANCSAGGTKVEVAGTPASKKYVCNGEDGETGFSETLPVGETETGAWAYGNTVNSQVIPLSFNIPLDVAPEALAYVNKEGKERVFVPGGEPPIQNVTPTHCLGSADAPTAPEGYVCVYAKEEVVTSGFGYVPIGAHRQLFTAGATFYFSADGTANDFAEGTFAVTAK